MKITIRELKKIVKEEVSKTLKEGETLSFSTPQQAAAHVRKIADKYYHEVEIDKPRQTMRMYKDEPDSYKEDLDMWKEDAKIYAEDRKDIYKLANLIAAKKYKAAAQKINDFDTMIRDMIPRSVFRFLQKADPVAAEELNWKYD
ncbi:MAG: hypothetical protein WC346_11500 [Methanogenium sp.]|jgi:hypothetical protein